MREVAPKLCPRWSKVVPSWRQDGPISSPKWPTWCPFGGYLAQDRLQTRIEAKFLAKLRPRWAHHGRSWGQLCPRRSKLEPSWRQDGPILSLSGRIETILRGILVIFLDSGQDLCRNRRSVKTTNPPSLLVFFKGRGLLGMVLGAVLGSVGEVFWKTLAPRWCFWKHL